MGFLFCETDRDVFYAVAINAKIIFIKNIIDKKQILKWCDFFSGQLESYSLLKSYFSNKFHKKMKRHILFKRDTITVKFRDILNESIFKDIYCTGIHKRNKSKKQIYANLLPFYSNTNDYFNSLIYDSVTMSYHPNIQKRKLICDVHNIMD